jgi:hypothetical protein
MTVCWTTHVTGSKLVTYIALPDTVSLPSIVQPSIAASLRNPDTAPPAPATFRATRLFLRTVVYPWQVSGIPGTVH